MPGIKVRDIREQLDAAMRGAGYEPSAYDFARLGRDAGSKVHRSFATHAPRRIIDGRQHVDAHATTTIEVRALVHRQLDDPQGYATDDAAEQMCNVGLFGFALDGVGGGLEVQALAVQPHTQYPQIDVVTVTFTARHRLWTEPEAT